jgi:hypothetical protein
MYFSKKEDFVAIRSYAATMKQILQMAENSGLIDIRGVIEELSDQKALSEPSSHSNMFRKRRVSSGLSDEQ